MNQKAIVNIDNCISCGACIFVCSFEAITFDDIAVIDQEKCNGCGKCVERCPVDAIELQ